MGANFRTAAGALGQELEAHAAHYDYHRLLWLLQSWRLRTPEGIGLLLRGVASLALVPAEVARIRQDVHCLVLETPVLGLYGPASALPSYYTEELLEDDEAAQVRRAFLDLFNHRALALLQQVWEKYRGYLRMQPEASDSFTEQVAALTGLGSRASFPFQHLDWRRLLPLAGLVSQVPVSAGVLEVALRDYFGLAGWRILENPVRWLQVPRNQRARLGQANTRLGQDCVLGSGIRDAATCFQLELRDIELATALEFLPGHRRYPELRELVEYLVSPGLDFELIFEIRSESAPQLVLRETGDTPRLGWETFLGDLAAAAKPEYPYQIIAASNGPSPCPGEG